MNIVDTLKQQLAGEVSRKLGSMVGIGDGELEKLICAGLPSLLSGLSSVASTQQGAGKIAEAIGGMDSNLLGNLGNILGGSAANSGGNLLGGLLGGSVVEGLAGVVAKFIGVNPAIVKSVLGFLTPMILGSLGGSFQGKKPNAEAITRLFAEQKNNIASSLPAGLSLDSVPGFKDLAKPLAAAASHASVPSDGGGLGKLLMPVLGLGVILLAGYYFFWQNNRDVVVEGAKDMANQASNAVKDVLPSAESIRGEVTQLLEGLSGDLGQIKDAAGADAALPKLKDSLEKMTTLSGAVNALPAGGKSTVSELIRAQLDKLNPILDQIGALPGVGEPAKQVLLQLKEKLASMI